MNEWCLRPRLCTVRLNWAGDKLGDELCYKSCPWRRIDLSTCWPAVQCATTVKLFQRVTLVQANVTECNTQLLNLICCYLALAVAGLQH